MPCTPAPQPQLWRLCGPHHGTDPSQEGEGLLQGLALRTLRAVPLTLSGSAVAAGSSCLGRVGTQSSFVRPDGDPLSHLLRPTAARSRLSPGRVRNVGSDVS